MMPQRSFAAIIVFLSSLCCAAPWMAVAQVNVTTFYNDIARTGANTSETVLTPSNVNSYQFGKLFSVAVDGDVYSQPLYVSNLSINGATHNILYVATEHDSLYAIDADSGTVYWQVSLIPSGGSTVDSIRDAACSDLVPEIGITGTPVIDPSSNTIYLVASTKENGNFFQRLHAIDLITHAEKFGGPVVISATVNGTGDGSSGGKLSFDPLTERQRSGLLLENSHIIIAWGSFCDNFPIHGWVMSYNASNLAQEAVFNTSPNGQIDGVWMSGDGVAADSTGNLFFATGNGSYDGSSADDYGDSIMKLLPPSGGSFAVADWFTPYDQSSMANGDGDLGSGGVLLLPDLPPGSAHQHLLVQMGKEGTIYLVNRDNMGKFCSSCTTGDTQIVQEIPGASTGIWGSPAYWNGSVYWGGGSEGGADSVKAFSFNANNSGLLSNSPTSVSSNMFAFPTAEPVISANGNSNGILWILDNSSYLSNCCQVLYAYDAANLANMFYNSNQADNNRDVPGGSVKFTAPIIANGKVYVGSQGAVSAFGIINSTPGISFVQGNSGPSTLQASNSSVAVTYSVAQNPGDLNVVAVGWGDTTSSITSVTDTRGNTYTLAVGPTSNTGLQQSIYYAKNIVAGSNTVTVKFNQAASYPDVRILEYRGSSTSSPLDAKAAAIGSGMTANSGPVTTTSPNELIFGAGTTATWFTAAGSGFVNRMIDTFGNIAEDKTVTSTGSYSATASNSSSLWIMQVATFAVQGTTTPAPTISAISPTSGTTAGGTSISITGTGFLSGASVTLGGTGATNVNVASSTSITATTAAHVAGAVNVVVTNTDGQSGTLTSGYTYISPNPAPTVTAISPVSGTTAGGTSVTIAGTAFLAGASVTLGGTAATNVNVVSSTSITATTAAHTAGAVNVTVTNTDGQSGALTNAYTYTNPAPTVTAISPVSGTTTGGTSVTITGTGFLSGASVTLGGTAATNVNVASSSSITATTAAHVAGAVNVVVTNTDGQSSTLTNGFTYVSPPTVTAISPVSGPASGGTSVTITGTGFLAGANVTLGGAAATNVNVVSSTSITATTPAHTAGPVNEVVTNTDGQSGTLSAGFTYTAVISFVQATSGPSRIQASSSSIAVTYPRSQIARDLNVVVVGWRDTTSSITSVTDTHGNVYSLAVGPTSNTGLQQSIYFAKNIAGGSNKLTVKFNQKASYPDVRILEYSGLSTTNPLDAKAAAAGNGTTANSGPASTTSANELIFGAGTTGTAFSAAGPGFVSRVTDVEGNIAEDEMVTTTGSYSATATTSSSVWVMQMTTFK